MTPVSPGELVKVAAGGPVLDGIVFDVPSREKVVVAVLVAGRGPAFRTVAPSTLSEREAAATDAALQALIRRTPVPGGGTRRAGNGAKGGSSAGHSRGAAHRATGK